MKKEYFWFLIFILAAAVLIGSTLGIISNFKYIPQQSKLRLQEQETSALQSTKTQNNGQATQDSLNPAGNTNGIINEQSSHPTAAKITIAATDNTTQMLISNAEKTEIEAMLYNVDISNNTEFNARVKHFQETNSLPCTGIIDSQTLQILIHQATIQKAVQHLAN